MLKNIEIQASNVTTTLEFWCGRRDFNYSSGATQNKLTFLIVEGTLTLKITNTMKIQKVIAENKISWVWLYKSLTVVNVQVICHFTRSF